MKRQNVDQATPHRGRYHPDLFGILDKGEKSYYMLNELLDDCSHCDMGTNWALGHHQLMRVKVLAVAPYTTSLKLTLEPRQKSAWSKTLELFVQVYHDVRVAEVVAFQRHKNMQARYEYPNPHMLLPDEKEQCNRFLAEWLAMCIAQRNDQTYL